MLEIKDHVAVITGGGSGIGEMVAKEWVKLGGKVVLGDVVKENLERVEKEIKDMGGQATSIVCDVTKEEDASALAKKAVIPSATSIWSFRVPVSSWTDFFSPPTGKRAKSPKRWVSISSSACLTSISRASSSP